MKQILKFTLFSLLVMVYSAAYADPSPKSHTPFANSCSEILKESLANLKEDHTPVSIFLVNGIKLQGRISDYDCDIIFLQNTITQMVFTNAISTIVPGNTD